MNHPVLRQNLHTHTKYCDGHDTVEDMVQAAIAQGYTSLGFSGHGYNRPEDPWSMSDEKQEKYIADVLAAREKYADQIDLYLGIEEDSIGRRFDTAGPFQYIIGSVHFVQKNGSYWPVDFDLRTTKSLLKEYDGNFLDYARDYYAAVGQLADREEVDIVGHVDLIGKYNERNVMFDPEDPRYLSLAFEAIDRLAAAGKIFEINTGAIARGYRTEPYPHKTLLEHIRKQGGRVCISADCHDSSRLLAGYEQALQLAADCGFRTLTVFNGKAFTEENIESFFSEKPL